MRYAACDSGEFYTPSPVIRFMVEVTDPRMGEVANDHAAGTGGFLVDIFEHLGKKCKRAEDFEVLQKGSITGGDAKIRIEWISYSRIHLLGERRRREYFRISLRINRPLRLRRNCLRNSTCIPLCR